jgi:ABC-type glycerol-3-phosphate transport system permease component
MMDAAQIKGKKRNFLGSPIKVRRIVPEFFRYLVLIAFFILFILPFFWIWISALKSSQEIALDPFALPSSLQWDNLVRAWTVGRFDTYFGNSLIYSVTVAAGVVLISCLAGYSFGFLKFPGRDFIFTLFLLGIMVPFQSIMIPLYYLVRDLHILGTRWAMIIPSIALGLSFGIFFMRAFFRGLPAELADAARIDGCNEWGVFRHVMLPLTGPALSTLTVFQFMWTWNSLLLPLVLVQREELRPVALGAMFFTGRYTQDRGMIAAGVTLTILPVILIYFVLQRQLIRGITAGALKG